MGVMCHHAIVVTSRDEYAETAHTKAIEICGPHLVTSLGTKVINGIRSFLVCPDGSKEGWAESDHGEALRALFVAWLDRQRWSDGSSPYKWVLIEYGERPHREGAAILDHAWEVSIGDSYDGPCDLSERM